MPSVRDLLAHAAQRLEAAGVPTPLVDAELLLAHVTGVQRAMLRMSGTTVTEDQAAGFAGVLERRVRREPLQHITGTAPFRHVELSVGPGVFIPRPETELLVDAVLARLAQRPAEQRPAEQRPAEQFPADQHPAEQLPADQRPAEAQPATQPPPADPRAPALIVDLCTGSGALAISLALEASGSRVHAVELSDSAHAWAARNVADHATALQAAGSSLTLHHADATRATDADGPLPWMRGQVDVVVANPPYVPDAAVPREPEVRDHDPHLALFGGPDGLDVVRLLVDQAALLLRAGGLLLVEHADSQGEAAGPAGVPALLRAHPAAQRAGGGDDPAPPPVWRDVVDHEDLAGRPRFTSAIRSGQPAR